LRISAGGGSGGDSALAPPLSGVAQWNAGSGMVGLGLGALLTFTLMRFASR